MVYYWNFVQLVASSIFCKVTWGKHMEDLGAQLEMQPGASEHVLSTMLSDLKTSLPEDYLEFLRRSNGAVGRGPDLFIILEPAEKIHELTTGYGATEGCPGLVVIGGGGCGNIIGIDARGHDPKRMDYVVLDPVWLDLESESCQHRSKTLRCVLEYVTSYGTKG